jgi:DNA-binding SARP family transcriptional activator/tetratricopeptide (TPR) repeat protein
LLLAAHALSAGDVMLAADLIDLIWDDRPPESARASLQTLIARLRHELKRVPECGLERHGDGYRLRVDRDLVDVHQFRSLARSARQAHEGAEAIALFDRALALWQGPALADVPATARAEAIRSGLEEEHLAAVQDRFSCLLAAGHDAEAAAEIPIVLALHPLSERLAGLLMLTWYRRGRQADALQVFRDLRSRLSGELGIEPGPELQSLHRQILSADATLAAPGAGGLPAAASDRVLGLLAAPALVPASDVAAAAAEADLNRQLHRAGYRAPRRFAPDGAGSPNGAGVDVVPHQLPPAPTSFTGRQRELRLLTGWLDGGSTAGVPVILVVTGTAGVGKTALALQWAHQLRDRFPDGELYLNLRGFGPSPAPAAQAEAIVTMLESLGVPPGRIPRQLDAQVGLYRSLLAGRRMLIVLDNARDEAQVRPLLPASARCAVLVTSRSQCVGLAAAEGARLVVLGLLTDREAGQLLAARLGAGRAAAEPESVAELADLCGRLPLALAITAAQAATRPAVPLGSLATGLRDARARFDALDAGDEAADIRSAFFWSYRLLAEPAGGMFRRLAAHPGPDITEAAAASLAGGDVAAARVALAELARASLVLEHAAGRFAMHDLLRAYAAQLCDEDERRAAIRRAAEHYLRVARDAMRLAYPAEDHRPPTLTARLPRLGTSPEPLADRVHAMAWLEAEHRVLLAMTAAAAQAGLDAHAWELPSVLSQHFSRRGYFPDWAESQRTALAAATRLGDVAASARAHRALGDAMVQLESVVPARSHFRKALAMYRRLGDENGQAVCHLSISRLFGSLGDPAAALSHARSALSMYSSSCHLAGQARALNSMGWQSAMLGRIPRGLSYCQQALELNRHVGDRFGEASTLDSIGYCWHLAGRSDEAIIHYEQALEAFSDAGDRYSLAHTLDRLADARRAIGSHEDADKAWQQAIALFDDMNHPDAGILRAKLHDHGSTRGA